MQWHRGAPNFPCNYALGSGPDVGSKVDINWCTDACTHSKQGVATEMRWLGHKHTAIQGHPGFHQTMHRGWTRYGKSDSINSCTDACTHSKKGVGPQVGWLGHMHSDKEWHPGFHQTMHRAEPNMGSQMDINSSTDACTHSKQGVRTEMRWQATNTLPYRGTQISIKLCIQGGADMTS